MGFASALRLLLPAAAAVVLAVPAAARDDAAVRELHKLWAFDARVATVGHRLAVGARDLCAAPVPRPGFLIHHSVQYPGPVLSRVPEIDGWPAVLAVAAGSPAERDGLRRHDALLSVDGAALPEVAGSDFAAMEPLLAGIEAAFADGAAEVEIRRGGTRQRLRIAAEPGCPTRFQTVPTRRPTAKADGTYVQLGTGLIPHLADEDELAAIVAHELAHNILDHRRRLGPVAERRGATVRITEEEADRLSVYLLDRAGYDPAAAARFWRRFGPRGLNLLPPARHHRWQRRVAAIEEEIAALAAAKAAGARLLPAFWRR